MNSTPQTSHTFHILPSLSQQIAKMILDETMELMATHWSPAEAKALLKGFIDSSKDLPKEEYDGDQANQDIHKCADQADALVDIYYYSQNAACKKGMNLSSVFNLVHTANMAKRDATTGKFIKREDGKVSFHHSNISFDGSSFCILHYIYISFIISCSSLSHTHVSSWSLGLLVSWFVDYQT